MDAFTSTGAGALTFGSAVNGAFALTANTDSTTQPVAKAAVRLLVMLLTRTPSPPVAATAAISTSILPMIITTLRPSA